MADIIIGTVLVLLGLSFIPVLDRTVVARNPAVYLCLLPADRTGEMLSDQVPMALADGLGRRHGIVRQLVILSNSTDQVGSRLPVRQLLSQERVEHGAGRIKGLQFILDIQGIKLQLLHVLKGTDLAIQYQQHPFHIPEQDEYIRMVGSCLSHLRPDIVIHRVTGDGPSDLMIAPLWSQKKRTVLNELHAYLKSQDIWQGKEYSNL